MKYTISYRKICYLLKRIWHTVCCFLWTKHLKAAYYNSEYLFTTLIFSSAIYHDRNAFMINSDPACTQTCIFRVENVCNGKSITNTRCSLPYTIFAGTSILQVKLELLQARGQIWRPAQKVIRGQGKSVVFCCRGKHTEITPVTDGLLLPCANTCGGRCS